MEGENGRPEPHIGTLIVFLGERSIYFFKVKSNVIQGIRC